MAKKEEYISFRDFKIETVDGQISVKVKKSDIFYKLGLKEKITKEIVKKED